MNHQSHSSATDSPAVQTAPLEADRLRQLDRLAETLGHPFKSPGLLHAALTHRSHNNQSGEGLQDYEGLEFLGDSILGFVISEFLFLKHPGLSAGELSKVKAFLVARNQLYRLSVELNLGAFLVLGRGEEKTGGRSKRAILADVFESVVAALYLDGGMEVASRFVLRRFQPILAKIGRRELEFRDFKSQLQELLHARGLKHPLYGVTAEEGPDHSKEFLVEVRIDGHAVATGRGRSKKEAEQRAASAALAELENSGDC